MFSKPKSHISKKDLKKQNILNAAREVFIHYGYKKASVVDIAERIGLDQATIYYYFDNKESLYVACILSEINDLKTRMHKAVSKIKTIKELITLVFTERLKFQLKSPLISNFSDLNIKNITEQMRTRFKNLREFETQLIIKVLNHSVESGELPPIDCTQFTSVLIHLMKGYQFKYRSSKLLGVKEVSWDTIVQEMEQNITFLFENLIQNKNPT